MATTILVLARTLHIGSAMLLVALPYFTLIVLGTASSANQAESYSSFVRKLTRWLWVLWWVEAASGVIWFWFAAAGMADQSPWHLLDSSDLAAVLWQTKFGQLWVGRLGLGLVLGLALILVSRAQAVTGTSSWRNWCVLGISTVLLITLTWAGHAEAGVRYRVLHVVVDVIHLVVGSVWPMGLIPLGLFLGQGRRGPFLPEDREIEVLFRFSNASVIAVIILTVTGFLNGWLMIGSWTALVVTAYGQLLLAKVFAVALMIGLGACNRLYLLPRLRAGATLVPFLRRTILAESGLAGVTLLIVGIMGMTSPPTP